MLEFERIKENQMVLEGDRTGCTLTSIPSLNFTLLFGGAKDNDVLVFDHGYLPLTQQKENGLLEPQVEQKSQPLENGTPLPSSVN